MQYRTGMREMAPIGETRNAPNPDVKIQKTPEPLKGKDTDRKTQKAPETTQTKSSDPKAQQLPETIQGENPRKPENCRARRRRESQLTTAAPRESSTLRWIPRGNALASWTCRHQEPRTAPVEAV